MKMVPDSAVNAANRLAGMRSREAPRVLTGRADDMSRGLRAGRETARGLRPDGVMAMSREREPGAVTAMSRDQEPAAVMVMSREREPAVVTAMSREREPGAEAAMTRERELVDGMAWVRGLLRAGITDMSRKRLTGPRTKRRHASGND